MKKMNKTILSIMVLFLFIMLVRTPILANSAQTNFSGMDSAGSMITDEDSPILVEKEILTFDIQEFPESYYKEVEDFLKYTGSVTAEYTFYNPADYTVTATLAFPFGGVADYANIYDYENEKNLVNVDTNKYDITVDGDVIEKQLRHTFMFEGEQFELEKDLVKLYDGFMVDDFYNPDQVVTKYTYAAKNVDTQEYKDAIAGFQLTLDGDNTKIYLENYRSIDEKGSELFITSNLNDEFAMFVIGKPLEELDWKFYRNDACVGEIDGTMELVSTETTTLKDFALSNYNVDYGILDYDWYNAMIYQFNHNTWSNIIIYDVFFDISNMLMRWYQYEITLEPQQRIVNTVTAPMYPSIDSDYEPDIFEYTYLLSPAKTWKEFGNLDIVINTPYYLVENNIEGFEYNNPGYSLHLTGLPEDDLVFTLCSEEKTISTTKYDARPIIFIISQITLFVGAIAYIIYVMKKKVD